MHCLGQDVLVETALPLKKLQVLRPDVLLRMPGVAFFVCLFSPPLLVKLLVTEDDVGNVFT